MLLHKIFMYQLAIVAQTAVLKVDNTQNTVYREFVMLWFVKRAISGDPSYLTSVIDALSNYHQSGFAWGK
jgi:hypothetical protein